MPDEQTIVDEAGPAIEQEAAEDKQGLTDLIRKHPGFALAGGLAIGLAAAALLPGSTRRKLARHAAAAAAAAGEAGLKLGKQGAGVARRKVADAADHARDTGIDWAKAAIGLLASLRR